MTHRIDIIPAIDIIDGKCVRLTEGKFDEKREYGLDPLEVAKSFEAAGITQLHLVQLDNAKAGKVENLDVLYKLASKTSLRIDYGGGIKSLEDVETILNAGANQVNIGSMAVKNVEIFEEILKEKGDFIILSADVKNGYVAINGWQEETKLSLEQLIERNIPHGLKYITCTDISKDGKLEGPSFQLYRHLKSKYPDIYLTASGGVSQISDLTELQKDGIDGVIIGKALYEGKIQLSELTKLSNNA